MLAQNLQCAGYEKYENRINTFKANLDFSWWTILIAINADMTVNVNNDFMTPAIKMVSWGKLKNKTERT